MTKFRVGDIVRRIEDGPRGLKAGELYTIREIRGPSEIALEEIQNNHSKVLDMTVPGPYWSPAKFEPVNQDLDFDDHWIEVTDQVIPVGRAKRIEYDNNGVPNRWWVKNTADYADWTVLRTPGDIDEPSSWTIKTPWGWVGVHSFDDQEPKAGFAAPGWQPPAAYSIVVSEPKEGE